MSLIIKTADEIAAEKQAQKQERIREEARRYLADTDWLVVRQAETGVKLPDEIRQARAQARATLSDTRNDT